MRKLVILIAVLWLALAAVPVWAAAGTADPPLFSTSFSYENHTAQKAPASLIELSRYSVSTYAKSAAPAPKVLGQERSSRITALPAELSSSRVVDDHSPWRFRIEQTSSANSSTLRKLGLSLRAVPMNGVNQAHWYFDPAFSQSAHIPADPGSSSEQEGGFLAVDWRRGSLGVTLGGGYTRLSSRGSESSGGGFSSGGVADLVPGYSGGSTATHDSAGRWSAYIAVPYHFNDRLGLRPEFTYSQWDSPSASVETNNEWVMGLNFSFGF